MRVLHFTAFFFPENSGTTTRLYNLLCRLPYEISLITSDKKMNNELILKKSDKIDNINIIRTSVFTKARCYSILVLRYLYSIYNYYKEPETLIEMCDGNKYDIIHAHNILPFGETARKISRFAHCPFVFELHGISDESFKSIYRYVAGLYFRKETERLIKSADHVLTLTQSLKEHICTSYNVPPEKVTVVPNGADIDLFAIKKEYKIAAADLKERLGIYGKIIMYAGVMDHINGIKDLALVIPAIIKENPNICFVFVGNGPEMDKLISMQKLYPQNIKCTGQVPYSEMPIYYEMSDVFIIPRPSTISSETITPLKLLEIMAMGKIVLGSDVGGVSEVIKHGYNGYLFKKGNMDSFKKALMNALDADNTQVGKHARKTIMDGYTWDKSAKILQTVYEDIV